MATQHPDNAKPSPFTGKCFVSAAEEIEECYKCFEELDVQEYMWDWEGKFVDEAVIDRLYQNYTDYFRKKQIGKDKFLTFRIPNIWEEKTHRLPRSFVNILAAEHAARNYKFHAPPIFEIILPMTSSSEQLIYLQKTFARVAEVSKEIFDTRSSMKMIDVIPLFEDIHTMSDTTILEEYLEFLQTEFNYKPEYMRIFVARSDPAMNAGLVPTLLGLKIAIANFHAFGKKHGIKIYPWVGGGSLPFRGAINPDNVSNTLDEYKGVYSLTIQSAFRSDYPLANVKQAIKKLNKGLPENIDKYTKVTDAEIKKILKFNKEAEKIFKKTIEPLAPLINEIAEKLPSNRERAQHTGLFGYSRGVGEVTLPRAIKFTGALYSIGLPPEFIATGRVIALARKKKMLPLLEKLYVNIKSDLRHAGKYLNKENLDLYAKEFPILKQVKKDIKEIEKYVGKELGPFMSRHFLHRNTSSNVYYLRRDGDDYTEELRKMAEFRRSLG